MYFTPSCYFMALTTMVKQPTMPALLLASLGVIGVVLFGFVTVTYLAPYFSVKMGMLDEYAATTKVRKKGKDRWLYILARVFARLPCRRPVSCWDGV